jgi:hypothetical protein
MEPNLNYEKWITSHHNEDDPENCGCLTCTENAAWDEYVDMRRGK